MSSNAAVAKNLSDILLALGNIPAERMRCDPKPGEAVIDDLLRVNDQGSLCELVDGTLVDKPTGDFGNPSLELRLCSLVRGFVASGNLGLISGPGGFLQYLALASACSKRCVHLLGSTAWWKSPGRQSTRVGS